MSDLAKKLEELHVAVVDVVKQRVEGGVLDSDGNQVPTTNDDLRVALQLLKQNQISAAAMPDTPMADLARMQGKLNFQTLEQKAKVVPIRLENKLSA
jgi:hypothetical protein